MPSRSGRTGEALPCSFGPTSLRKLGYVQVAAPNPSKLPVRPLSGRHVIGPRDSSSFLKTILTLTLRTKRRMFVPATTPFIPWVAYMFLKTEKESGWVVKLVLTLSPGGLRGGCARGTGGVRGIWRRRLGWWDSIRGSEKRAMA
eukprot:748511-Hanusia_phi.AAC.2